MKWLCLVFLFFLTACNFKPQYQRPCMEMPTKWRFCANENQNDSANIRWWEQFEDPVLDELIQLALENNQDLKVATARVLQFFSEYRMVASQLYPQINLEASYLRQDLPEAISYSPIPPALRINNLYNYAFMLSYEIDFWGRIRNATEAALSVYFSEIASRRTVILTLISSLASAYVQLRQFDKQLEIAQMTFESRKEYWHLATLRYEGGLVSEMEVMQALAEMQTAEIIVKQYEEIIPQQEDLISVLIGEPSSAIARGRTIEELSHPQYVPAGLPSNLLENRPDIVSAELKLIAANAQIGVARAAFFPAISLTGLYGGESTSLKNLFTNTGKTWNFGVSALQPLFTGGFLTYQLKEAKAIALEAVHTYQQTILKAFQEVNDALIAHQKLQEIVVVQKNQVAALEEYLKLSFLRYDNGQNDYLTVLDAQTKLFESQLNLAQSEADVFLSLIALYKALGGGWVVDADYCFELEVAY